MSHGVEAVRHAIDAAAKRHGFQCQTVSWEDCTRQVNTGFGLSTGGRNISDVRLWEKSGHLLYTVRSQNWNERLGYVAAKDVALMTGNEKPTASALAPTTLSAYLQSIGTLGGYAGVKVPALFDPALDNIFGIRFQTVFLPVAGTATAPVDPFANAFGARPASAAAPPATEFCTEVMNYQTHTETNPKNLVLLATPQGVSLQQDGVGRSKVFFHSVAPGGEVHRYWLEAEKSDKQVGGAQVETKEEALAAAARGKSTAVRIGPSSMGTRFNVQLLIQVPLKQAANPHAGHGGFSSGGGGWGSSAPVPTGTTWGIGSSGGFGAKQSAMPQQGTPAAGALAPSSFWGAAPPSHPPTTFCAPSANSFGGGRGGGRGGGGGFGRAATTPIGESNAARVSRGSRHDTWPGVAHATPERDPAQHGTITVTLYYTVVGGVPSSHDVEAACRDLDELYKQCPSDKSLVDCTEVTSKGMDANPHRPPSYPAPHAGPGPAGHAWEQLSALCQNGHCLTEMRGGEAHEPAGGWWCDGCGLFLPHGAPAPRAGLSRLVAPKGFGCRACDFDLCASCAAGPRCPAYRALTARHDLVQDPVGTTPCSLCCRPFANRAAIMRGCTCSHHNPFGTAVPGRYVICDQCYRVERAKRL